jgi:ADP-ribosyltransferase exoenzyme
MSVATAEPTALKTNIKKLKRDNAKLIKGLAAEWAVAWQQKMDMKNIDASTPGWLAQAQQVQAKYQSQAEELANAYVGTWGLVGEPPEPLPKQQLNVSLLVTGPMAAKHHMSQHHDEQAASNAGKLGSLGAATRHTLNAERSVITNTAKKAPGMAGWQRVGSGTSTCQFCNKIIDGGVVQTEPTFASHDHCHCVPQMVTAEQAAALEKEAKNKAKRIRATKREIKKLQETMGNYEEGSITWNELAAKLAKLQTKLHTMMNPGPAEDQTPMVLADQKAAAAKLAEAEELAKKKKAEEEAAAKLKQDEEFLAKQIKLMGEDDVWDILHDKIKEGDPLTEPEAKFINDLKAKKAKEAAAKAKAEAAAKKKEAAEAVKAAKALAAKMAKIEEKLTASGAYILSSAKSKMFGPYNLKPEEAMALFRADPVKALGKAKVVNGLPDGFEPKMKLIDAIRKKKAAGEMLNAAETEIWAANDPAFLAQKQLEEQNEKNAKAEARKRANELAAASREGLDKLLKDPDTEYRQIADGRKSVTFGNAVIRTWNDATRVHSSDKMPVSVNRAVGSYRGSGYQAMNRVLRKEESGADDMERVRVLQQAITERPIPASAVVYRGVKNRTGRYNNVKVGDQITDSAFMSTSVEQSVAKGFSGYYTGGEHRPAMFEIYTPQGTPVLTGDLGPNQGEHELIFGPGTTYQITSISEKDGRLWFRAVIVKTPIADRT